MLKMLDYISSARRQGGFTFLEIMLVVLLMGIILSLGVLAFPARDSNESIRKQAENIQEEIANFKFKMQLAGKVGLIKVSENSLTFSSITKGKITFLSTFKIDDPLKIEFEQKKEDQLYQQKMIVFLPPHEQTPFEIKLSSKAQDNKTVSMVISAKDQGSIQLEASKS